MRRLGKVHLADPGTARLVCPVALVGRTPSSLDANWTWKPERVTCKRCLAIYRKEAARRGE